MQIILTKEQFIESHRDMINNIYLHFYDIYEGVITYTDGEGRWSVEGVIPNNIHLEKEMSLIALVDLLSAVVIFYKEETAKTFKIKK